jgi:hypothetical protein
MPNTSASHAHPASERAPNFESPTQALAGLNDPPGQRKGFGGVHDKQNRSLNAEARLYDRSCAAEAGLLGCMQLRSGSPYAA